MVKKGKIGDNIRLFPLFDYYDIIPIMTLESAFYLKNESLFVHIGLIDII